MLTDGQQNAGTLSPLQAAQLAADGDIKIYTIAVTGGGRRGIFGPPRLDTRELQAVAERTGGTFFKAESADALKEIYRTIDELEKSKIESRRFLDYKELFQPFALAALAVVALEVLLACTLFRKIP